MGFFADVLNRVFEGPEPVQTPEERKARREALKAEQKRRRKELKAREKSVADRKAAQALKKRLGGFDNLVDDMDGISLPRPLPCVLRSSKEAKNRQAEVARYLLTHRAVIAAHGIGTGKTLLAVLAGACALRNIPTVNKVVVMSPRSLVANFYEALRAYGPAHPEAFQVITFDDLVGVYKPLLTDEFGDMVADLRPFEQQMAHDFGDAMLIVDEAHVLRTTIVTAPGQPLSKGVKPFVALHAAAQARRVLLLTATPVVNAPLDIVNLVAMARGDLEPLGRRGLERLVDNGLLGEYCPRMFSFFKAKTQLDDYPRVVRHDEHLVMTKAQQTDYERIELDALTEDDAHLDVGDPLSFYSGIRQAVNLPDIGIKAERIAEILLAEPAAAGRRAIVLSAFLKHGISVVEDALDNAGLTYTVISGETSDGMRVEAKRQFDADEVNVIILSMGAGGTGLSFDRVRHLFLFEPSWNQATTDQAEGRAIRFRSHTMLPAPERVVHVHRFRVSKDPKRAPAENTARWSADDILLSLADRKEDVNQVFLDDLRKLDIGPRLHRSSDVAPEDATEERAPAPFRAGAFDAKQQDRRGAGPRRRGSTKAAPKADRRPPAAPKRRASIKAAPTEEPAAVAKFCSVCGARFGGPADKFCTQCGAQR